MLVWGQVGGGVPPGHVAWTDETPPALLQATLCLFNLFMLLVKARMV